MAESFTVCKGSAHIGSSDGTINIKSFAITGNVVVAPFSVDERGVQEVGWILEGESEGNIHSVFPCRDMTFIHVFSDLNYVLLFK